MKPPPARVIALGASNLTRGFPGVVAAARARGGPDVEIVAALGLGRSYGMPSRVLARTLPGILDSGLWSAIAGRPRAPTRALVTDVGNDILYGASPERILEWVGTALERLSAHTDDIVITGLPLQSIRRLSRGKFLAFRSILYPGSRLPFERVVGDSELTNEGLARLAATYRARFVPLRPEWYGFDPVHIRPGRWGAAWQEILGESPPDARPSKLESARLFALPPERRWLFGVERVRPQSGTRLAAGGRVWLF